MEELVKELERKDSAHVQKDKKVPESRDTLDEELEGLVQNN